MNKVNKDILYELYITQNKPMHEISKELGIAIGTVYNYLHLYNIKTRSKEDTFNFKGKKHSKDSIEKMCLKQKGRFVSKDTKKKQRESKLKKGIGHKKKRCDGYITVYFPDHPKSNNEGYIMEHVLVMGCCIGRNLNNDEVVHHINGDRSDNRIENLKLMTFKEHARYHMQIRQDNKRRNGLSIR